MSSNRISWPILPLLCLINSKLMPGIKPRSQGPHVGKSQLDLLRTVWHLLRCTATQLSLTSQVTKFRYFTQHLCCENKIRPQLNPVLHYHLVLGMRKRHFKHGCISLTWLIDIRSLRESSFRNKTSCAYSSLDGSLSRLIDRSADRENATNWKWGMVYEFSLLPYFGVSSLNGCSS